MVDISKSNEASKPIFEVRGHHSVSSRAGGSNNYHLDRQECWKQKIDRGNVRLRDVLIGIEMG